MRKLFFIIIFVFIATKAIAIQGYQWGMSAKQAEQVAREIGKASGLALSFVKKQNNTLIYQTLSDGRIPVGITILKFDHNGGLSGVGSTITTLGKGEINRAKNVLAQADTALRNNGYKLAKHEPNKNFYLSKTDRVVLFIKDDISGIIVGVVIERR